MLLSGTLPKNLSGDRLLFCIRPVFQARTAKSFVKLGLGPCPVSGRGNGFSWQWSLGVTTPARAATFLVQVLMQILSGSDTLPNSAAAHADASVITSASDHWSQALHHCPTIKHTQHQITALKPYTTVAIKHPQHPTTALKPYTTVQPLNTRSIRTLRSCKASMTENYMRQ